MTFLHLLLAALLGLGAPAPATAPDPVALLRDWDQRRAEAWATGDVAGLRHLYAPDSRAGATDVAMLRAWRARGLRVVGMRMQLLSVAVRVATEDRLVLVVADRLASAVALGEGVRRPLPRDTVSVRRIVLVRAGGAWRVETVTTTD